MNITMVIFVFPAIFFLTFCCLVIILFLFFVIFSPPRPRPDLHPEPAPSNVTAALRSYPWYVLDPIYTVPSATSVLYQKFLRINCIYTSPVQKLYQVALRITLYQCKKCAITVKGFLRLFSRYRKCSDGRSKTFHGSV